MNAVRKHGYDMYTKSNISTLFRRYAATVDPVPFQAAAQVFPMRVNNHVAEDLIDW